MPPFGSPGRHRGTVLALAGMLTAGVFAAPAAAGTPPRVALPDPVPSFVAGATVAADPQEVLPLRVYLDGADPVGRVAAVTAVSTPGSAGYAHYLTPARYAARFGASTTQIHDVSGWLRSFGMDITATNVHYLTVNATIAEADAAFDTDIMQYPIGAVAPVDGVSVPAALGNEVATVTGLEFQPQQTSPTPTSSAPERSPATSGDATRYPCSKFWGQHTVPIPAAYGHTTAPTPICGYTPTQLREAYGVTAGAPTGRGRTIAILLDGHSSTMLADANRYFADEGVAGFAAGQYTENVDSTFAGTCGDDAELPEEAIDVETAHIAAPDAKVVYVGADCGFDQGQSFLDAAFRIVDSHLADVVSNSFPTDENGFSAADVAAWDLAFQQGAMEGIGFDFSSGDDGDGGGGGGASAPLRPADLQPTSTGPLESFPTTDQYATAVGGTSLEIGRTGTAVGEFGWGDNDTAIDPNSIDGSGYDGAPPGGFVLGSGGGPSTLVNQPAYQAAAVPGSLATTGGTTVARRVVPDVSADSGIFWEIGYTGEQPDGSYGETNGGGGTSGSTPLLAGLEVDAGQAAGHALGFVNPALYRLRGTGALHDVLPVSPADPPVMAGLQSEVGTGPFLTTLGEDTSLTVTPGYDDVTGLGSPTPSFVHAFNGF